MSIDWDADLLSPVMGIFGEDEQSGGPVIYQPVALAPFVLEGAVFDRAYAEIILDPEQGQITNRRPCLGVRRALLPQDPLQDDLVYVPSVGITYVVKDVQPDGHGHVKLMIMATPRLPLVVP